MHLNYISKNSFEYTSMIEQSIDLKKNISNIYNKSLKLVKNMASASMQINACFYSSLDSYSSILFVFWISHSILRKSNKYKTCSNLAIKK